MASNGTSSHGKSLEEIKAEARRYALANTRLHKTPYSPTHLAPPSPAAAVAAGGGAPGGGGGGDTTAAGGQMPVGPPQQQPQQQQQRIGTATTRIGAVTNYNTTAASTAAASAGATARPTICIDDEEYLRFVIALNDDKDQLVDKLLPGDDDDDEFLLDPLDDEDEALDEEDDDDFKLLDPSNHSTTAEPMDHRHGSSVAGNHNNKHNNNKQHRPAGRSAGGEAAAASSGDDNDVDMDWDIQKELGWLQQDDEMDLTTLNKMVNEDRKMTPEQKSKYHPHGSSSHQGEHGGEVAWMDKLSGLNADRANPPMPTAAQQEKLRSLLKRHYQLLLQQAIMAVRMAQADKRKVRGHGARQPQHNYSRYNANANTASNANNADKAKQPPERFVATETADDLIEIVDSAVGKLIDLRQQRQDSFLSILAPQQDHLMTRAQFRKVKETVEGLHTMTLFDVPGLDELDETFASIDNSVAWMEESKNILSMEKHADACHEIFKARKLDYDEDLVPGTKDISTVFSHAMEVLGADFRPPCTQIQEMYLRRQRNIFTAAEDNLAIRGVNQYGEKQWLMISDRLLPDRSVNIISHRYAKLTTMIFQAHGVPIQADGSLPPLKKVSMIQCVAYDDLHSLKLVPAPPQVSLRKWTIEEDLALLKAATVLGTMWAEISNRVLPHRDRGHLRKRYQVLERRIKATCCRDEKNGGASWRTRVKPRLGRRDKSGKGSGTADVDLLEGSVCPPAVAAPGSPAPSIQPKQAPGSASKPGNQSVVAPPPMQYIPMHGMMPMFQQYPHNMMQPNYAMNPGVMQHPQMQMNQPQYAWIPYPPANFMGMGGAPMQAPAAHNNMAAGTHANMFQQQQQQQQAAAAALQSPSRPGTTMNTGSSAAAGHDTTASRAAVDELLREGSTVYGGGGENSLAAVERLMGAEASMNGESRGGNSSSQQSLFSGVMKLAGTVAASKTAAPAKDPPASTKQAATNKNRPKTSAAAAIGSPRQRAPTPPCYFPSPSSATVGTFGPIDSNHADFSRTLPPYRLFGPTTTTTTTGATGTTHMNDVNAEQLEAASALSALSRSPALKKTPPPAAAAEPPVERSKPTRSLFSLVTGRDSAKKKSKSAGGGGGGEGQPPAKRKKTK